MASKPKSERSILAAENRKLIRKVTRRIGNLNKRFGVTPATKKLIEMNVPMYTKGLTLQQLKNQRRDLLYFSGLKTSYVKGMKSFEKHWKKIENYFEAVPESKDKFWELYNKFVEEHVIMMNYKYDITEVIYAGMSEGKTEEQIVKELDTLFNAIQYGEEEISPDENLTRLFYIPRKSRK